MVQAGLNIRKLSSYRRQVFDHASPERIPSWTHGGGDRRHRSSNVDKEHYSSEVDSAVLGVKSRWPLWAFASDKAAGHKDRAILVPHPP